MGTHIDIDGDPNEFRGVGAAVRAMIEGFKADAGARRSEITSLDSGRPWGSDTWGEDFDKQYNQAGEDGKSASERIKDMLGRAGDQADDAGLMTMRMMDGAQVEDHQAGRDIGSAYT